MVLVPVDEGDGVVGHLARGRAARLHRSVDRHVQHGAVGAIEIHPALEAAMVSDREVVEAEHPGREIAVLVQRLGGRAHVAPEARPPDRLVPGDGRRPAPGGNGRHRVARRRRVRPAVDEQRALGGQRVERRRGRAPVAVAAEVIGAQRVDGDQQQIEIGRDRRRQLGHRRGWRQRVGRVLTVAVGVDAVARDVDARPDGRPDRCRRSRRRRARGRSRRRRSRAAPAPPPAPDRPARRARCRPCAPARTPTRAGARAPPGRRSRPPSPPWRPADAGDAGAARAPPRSPPRRSPARRGCRSRGRSGDCRPRRRPARSARARRRPRPRGAPPPASGSAAAAPISRRARAAKGTRRRPTRRFARRARLRAAGRASAPSATKTTPLARATSSGPSSTSAGSGGPGGRAPSGELCFGPRSLRSRARAGARSRAYQRRDDARQRGQTRREESVTPQRRGRHDRRCRRRCAGAHHQIGDPPGPERRARAPTPDGQRDRLPRRRRHPRARRARRRRPPGSRCRARSAPRLRPAARPGHRLPFRPPPPRGRPRARPGRSSSGGGQPSRAGSYHDARGGNGVGRLSGGDRVDGARPRRAESVAGGAGPSQGPRQIGSVSLKPTGTPWWVAVPTIAPWLLMPFACCSSQPPEGSTKSLSACRPPSPAP